MMQYQRIKYFLEAAVTLNFTEAANKQYISAQAMAKQIALLEEELGIKLFERTTRSIHLTVEGETCFKLLQEVDMKMEAALNEIKSLSKRTSNELWIGVFSGLSRKEITSPLISRIKNRFPELTLELVVGDFALIREGLLNRNYDLCLTYMARGEDLGGMKAVRIGSYPAKLVVGKNHSWARKQTISIEDLKLKDMLCFVKNEAISATNFYESIPCKAKVQVKNYDTMLAYLEMSDVFAVFPAVYEQLDHSKFKYFDLPGHPEYMDIVCLSLGDQSKKIVENIMNLIESEFHSTESDTLATCGC